MTVTQWVAYALLWLGVGAVVLASVAVAVLPGMYAKLHGLTPATTVGAVLIGVAIALREGPGHTGGKVAFVAFLMLVTGPVVTAATARAAHIRAERSRPAADATAGDSS